MLDHHSPVVKHALLKTLNRVRSQGMEFFAKFKTLDFPIFHKSPITGLRKIGKGRGRDQKPVEMVGFGSENISGQFLLVIEKTQFL